MLSQQACGLVAPRACSYLHTACSMRAACGLRTPPAAPRTRARLSAVRVAARSSRQSYMAWRESLDDRARAVLVFWFGKGYAEMAHTGMVDAHVTKMWFNAGPEFDETVRSTFTADLEALAAGEYDPWLTSSNVYNGIAGIVLADQFSRNAFRGTARAFELDPKARKWASYLLDSGHAADIPLAFRAFLNIPFVHSEAEEDVQRCVDLTGATLAEGEAAEPPAKDELLTLLRGQYRYAVLHLDVIKRWGRYPHRNAALGRPDTPEEAAGLADGSIMRF